MLHGIEISHSFRLKLTQQLVTIGKRSRRFAKVNASADSIIDSCALCRALSEVEEGKSNRIEVRCTLMLSRRGDTSEDEVMKN